jgi:HK97 family phage prohead protease
MAMALTGYAALYNRIIWRGGEWQMLLPGAFDKSLRSGTTVQLLLNHRPECCVGSTLDILELYSDKVGLAFRARLTDTDDRKTALFTALWMAKNHHHDMSIGFQVFKEEIRKIGGKDVTRIVHADLEEISYLYGNTGGAIKETHAIYQDVDFNRSLRDECNSGKHQYDGAAVNFTRALNKLEQQS